MEPILPFSVEVPRGNSGKILQSIYRQLRSAVLEGRLALGFQMPPTRKLAAALGVSRNTVIAAYDLLSSEGYLIARPGAGTFVSMRLVRQSVTNFIVRPSVSSRIASASGESPRQAVRPSSKVPLTDFGLGVPDVSKFPFDVWRRLMARAMRELAKEPARYSEPEGRPALREAITHHVSFARAIACQAQDVIVTAGAQQAFDLLARSLVEPGRTLIAVEDPGYSPAHRAFVAAGASLVRVPVDLEGIRVDQVPKDVGIILVTPSHQFPLGVVMSPARRAALIDLARERGVIVIEDDYDSEFRFGGRTLDALQTLDPVGSVFYVGTFSKSLFPGLRLGFVVVPPWARQALIDVKRLADWHSPTINQDALAAFITEGHLARHIRRMRRIYAERRTVLLEGLSQECGKWLMPIPSEAGLHIAFQFRTPIDVEATNRAMQAVGINLECLDRFAASDQTWRGVVFGYGGCRTEQVLPAVAKLSRIFASLRGGAG